MGPMHWIRGWGLAYGIYPWQRTGDGRFDGEAFWMGCGFCFWGGGGGEEELQGTTAEMMFMHMQSMLLYVICLLHVYVCYMLLYVICLLYVIYLLYV